MVGAKDLSGQAIEAGGLLAAVTDGSPAHRAGLHAGMRVLAVDGMPVTDVLDLIWRADGPCHAFSVATASGERREIQIARDAGEPWGFEFGSPIFDTIKTCENACTFCFVAQLPPGLRPSLYVRDDDYRLSFLFGNFITLTNVSDAERDRIVEQRLTPLYVSVHAVTPVIRERLIGPHAALGFERLRELLAAGVEIHAQVVVVPGVNDGEELDRTLAWLARFESVQSVGVVPVGFTRHQGRVRDSYTEPDRAAALVAQVHKWQQLRRERLGRSWVHAADEFYINAGLPFPSASEYDDFPQFENGIGIARSLIDEARSLLSELRAAAALLPERDMVTVVTAVLPASILAGALSAAQAAGRVRLLVVENGFFGGNVSVTGLLTGFDIARAIERDAVGGVEPGGQRSSASRVYLLPDVVFNDEGLTLDGMRSEELAGASGAEVRVVSSDARGLLAGIREAAAFLLGG